MKSLYYHFTYISVITRNMDYYITYVHKERKDTIPRRTSYNVLILSITKHFLR